MANPPAGQATANFPGLPAVALPVGLHEGIPQGVQISGPSFGEDACLDGAAAIKERLGLSTRIDPVPQRAS